jgi:hypothetical protein
LRVEAVAIKQKDQEAILGITVALLAVRMSTPTSRLQPTGINENPDFLSLK